MISPNGFWRRGNLRLTFVILAALLLAAACSPGEQITPTPTETPTLVPTASPVPTLQDIIIDTETPTPTFLPTVIPVEFTAEPQLSGDFPPPLTITLPDSWQYGTGKIPVQDLDGQRDQTFALYTGPVTGGKGFIVLLWGFPNVNEGNPFAAGGGEVDLWADGLRLIHLAIIEPDCNLGTDLKRDFTVGGKTAVGTYFTAVECSQEPDTRGWFAGLQEKGLNFVFYVYTDPITAMDGPAQNELQSILDTVVFTVPDVVTETPTP